MKFVIALIVIIVLCTPAHGQTTAEDWFNRGVALNDLGKYAEAIQAYDKAIQLNPKYPDAWYNKGIVLNSLGGFDESIQAIDRAIQLNPKYADAWNFKGIDLGMQGKYDGHTGF